MADDLLGNVLNFFGHYDHHENAGFDLIPYSVRTEDLLVAAGFAASRGKVAGS